jgi:hypothetical protein
MAEQETSVQQVARRNKPAAGIPFLVWPIFYPEDEGDTFLRNVSSHTDYTALYIRRW